MKAGVVQPTALMDKVIPQLDALIKDKPEDTLFWGPIKNMPGDFSRGRQAAPDRRVPGDDRTTS